MGVRMAPPYKKIHVIINPASGKDEPILNVINRVFRQYDVDWDLSITHASGDATRFAREAVQAGVDLVASYGGDGTLLFAERRFPEVPKLSVRKPVIKKPKVKLK